MNNDERIEKVKKALLGMQRYSWEHGVAAQSLLEIGEQEWVILLAKDAVVRQTKDGRLGFMGDMSATDPAANGEAVLFSAKVTGEKKFEQAAEKMLEWVLQKAPKNDEGIIYHVLGKQEVWVDSFYMVPPFLAVAGYYDDAIKQIDGFRKLLWSPEHKLYSHMWDDAANDFARKDFWGVGNGWAAAGMTRVLKALPDSMGTDRKRLAGYVKDVIDGCLAYKRDDHLFHDVVDHPETFRETNLAQMLSYSIYCGVARGWLDKAYLEPADAMRQAAHQQVDEFGLVQEVCGSPHFDHSGTAPEGQAFFLLMEAASRELARA